MILHSLLKRVVFMFFFAISGISFADTPTYTFSVVPQFKPAQLQKEWGPLLARISSDTGIKLKLAIPSSIPNFESDLAKGNPDFAFVNPYQAVLGMKEHGYIPMLRNDKPLNGILVVSKDSGISKISDLEGKVIGFPAPNAFGATVYMRASLATEKLTNFTPRYLNNHNLVFKHIQLGNVAAGGTVNSALNDEPENVREQLMVLYKTPDVASHPITVHPRVPEQVRKSVINAIVNLQHDAEGQNLLKEIRFAKPVDASFQKDYAGIEKLNLQKYFVAE